jgi:hypothetical protein
MTETGKFLQRRAALGALVAIPIAAIGAVFFIDDDPSLLGPSCGACGHSQHTDRCGVSACECGIADSSPPAPAALPYDYISEDDGDL